MGTEYTGYPYRGQKIYRRTQDNLRNLPNQKNKSRNNLSHREKVALRKLKQRKDIIIKPADKGSGVCILSTEQYKEEIVTQLSNGQYYKIESDKTPQIAQ